MTSKEQERTFLAWMEEHQGILVKVARAFAEPDAQDELYQELMIAAWQAVPAYRGEAKVSTFLYRVAYHRALTWVRRRRTYRERIAAYWRERSAETVEPVALRQDSNEVLVERLYAALRKLNELDRSLMILHLDGAPYREMASALGITESNVGARLTRARKRLARLLEEEDQP